MNLTTSSARAPRPDIEELQLFVMFGMCQMRWQSNLLEKSFTKFDAYMHKISPERGATDVASNYDILDKIVARSDTTAAWVPWHTVANDTEMFVLNRIRSLDLPAREKVMWAFAFAASRDCAMWSAVVVPIIRQGDINDPDACFGPSSRFHARLAGWRRKGHRLHTRAFRSIPPQSATTTNYVGYIAQLHATYAHLGFQAYCFLHQPNITANQLDTMIQDTPGIGPTISKILLVTLHHLYPGKKLLEKTCPVGVGAATALEYLYPNDNCRSNHSDNKRRLADLHRHLVNSTAIDHRFHPTIKWLGRRTRRLLRELAPKKSIATKLTMTDLQVQLCEWQKFRNKMNLPCPTPNSRPRRRRRATDIIPRSSKSVKYQRHERPHIHPSCL